MTTLREAAEASLDALKEMRQKYGEYDCRACDHADVAIIKLCTALAEPVQEPVAWLRVIDGKLTSNDGGNFGKEWTPLYTAPRKPLAEWQINDLIADIDPEDVCSWSFRQGVYAAEKHHGVRS